MGSFWRWTQQGWDPWFPVDGPQADRQSPCQGQLRVESFGQGAECGTALLLPPETSAWVNGVRMLGGLRVLEHKDEILVGEERLVFSAEGKPEIVVFRLKPGQRAAKCGICKRLLRDGFDLVVHCPHCGRTFHQMEAQGNEPARLCWTYRTQCIVCSHGTSLDGPGWRPEMEEAYAD